MKKNNQKTVYLARAACLPRGLYVLFALITHAGCIAAGVSMAFSRVCLFVRALTGKRLELLKPNFIHVYSIAVARHALTQRSKGQRSRSHGYESRHGRHRTPLVHSEAPRNLPQE